MRLLGIIASSLLKKITDTFTRTTSGELGTSDSGQLWSNISGIWFSNGTKAQSDTSVSGNTVALAGINLAQNATISASVTLGTGVAFWVTDSGSWWASTSYSSQTSTSCNCSTCYNTCNCSTCGPCYGPCNCSTCCTTQQCPEGKYLCSNTCWNGPLCTGGVYWAQPSPTCVGPYSCNCDTCQTSSTGCAGTYACNPYNCNCQTCTTTSYYLKLLKSIAGTVSDATGAVSLSSAAAAIYVSTVGNDIIAKAFSDAGMSTQLGTTISYTATSPTKGSIVGIIKAESSYGQDKLVDNFTAQA